MADIRSFTGFTNFYQEFVPNYANIVAPLSSLLRKEVEWVWGDAQQKAFDTVILKLVHSTTLAFHDKDKTFHVHRTQVMSPWVQYCHKWMAKVR